MCGVRLETVEGGVAWVVIDRPEAMNAMSRAIRLAFSEALAAAEADPEVRAIVVTGAGDKAFSAGLDLHELASDETALREVASDDPTVNPAAAVDRCRKPVIGAVNGVCVTGALELALACDILIASDSARFADTHAKVGLLPVWGLSQRLQRSIGPGRAREMSLSGQFIDANTAAAWGLVSRVVPAQSLNLAALALARAIAGNQPEAVQANKALMKRGFEQPLGEALAYEREMGAAFNAGITPAMLDARRKALIGR